MTGAVLRPLQHGERPARRDNRCDLFRLVADYHHGFARLQRFASPHNLLDQRSSTGAVQHLCQTGLQPRAFAGRENHNGEIIVGHSFETFCGSGGYFATEGCLRRGESLISSGHGREGG